LLVDRIAGAGRVRAHDRVLQLDGALGLDVHLRERAEPGRDPVHDVPARDHVVHQRARRRHARGNLVPHFDRLAMARDCDDIVDRERLAGKDDAHRLATPAAYESRTAQAARTVMSATSRSGSTSVMSIPATRFSLPSRNAASSNSCGSSPPGIAAGAPGAYARSSTSMPKST